MSEDSQALLQRFKHFQAMQESENPKPAVSELTTARTAKERPDESQALLGKFIQWQQRSSDKEDIEPAISPLLPWGSYRFPIGGRNSTMVSEKPG